MIFKKLFLVLTLSVLTVNAFAGDAPELIGAKNWLNTDKPLTLQDLRGKVVLLDFWTYGCINCIHIIPDLKKLEAKYKNELVVIGVHSGKFVNERETENIRKIIARYGLEHPIANDADFKIWDAYSVMAWPTQVLIDPNGDRVLQTTGEGRLNLLDQEIGGTIEEFRAAGKLDEKPLKFTLEKEKSNAAASLLFPGKILADAKSNRLFIADSNHNRIVVTTLAGDLLETIGGTKAAFKDGDFSAARFNRLQGMAFDGKNLFVADTENHAIRKIDFAQKTVETIAGTGAQGGYVEVSNYPARATALNSPWDLQLVGNDLYIAMAGLHQIWRMNLANNEIAPFAGSGREARADAKLGEAAFAQPSGLAFDGANLIVADSESNIVRRINLKDKTVETLAGGDLFEFGDTDGAGDAARLQHPLGVAATNKQIFIADTYNHKIKTLDPATKTVKTFSGDGTSGAINGARAKFYEPGGVSIAGDKLFVADTNNNQIRLINLRTKTVSTLKINNLRAVAARN